MSQTHQTTLAHSISLTRQHVGKVDDLGIPSFWEAAFHQLYARMPFPSLWKLLSLVLWHMDRPDNPLRDYDHKTPGYQVAAGLCLAFLIELGIFPKDWKPEDIGLSRAIFEQMRQDARKTLVHEVGHFYFNASRMFDQNDDITRLCYRLFDQIRLRYAAGGIIEDAAEHYRLILGTEETIGTFSDGVRKEVSPELRSLVVCLYWLGSALKGCWVQNLQPQNGWVLFQVFIGWGWEWRCVSAVDWHQERLVNGTWVRM